MTILDQEFKKLTVLDRETGERIAVVTDEAITTARDTVVVVLTPAAD